MTVLFQPLKMSFHVLPASRVSDEESSICKLFGLDSKALFLCCCFQGLLSSVFGRLLMMGLGRSFFGFTPFGVCSVSWICRFMSSAKFGRFSAFISLTIFFSLPTPPRCLLSFWTLMAQMWDLLLFCTGSWGSEPHPNLFSICFLDWVISVVLSSSSLILSSFPPVLLWSHLLSLLIQLLYFFF